MERLTSPNINVDLDTDRFLHATIGGKEIDWKQSRDSTLNVLINGPTSNGFGKDIFRKMARDLYGRLKAYEDTGLEPEAVETVKLALAAKHLVDLETLNNTPISRLVELAEADKDGRVRIMPESQNETCGNCDNFKRESGTRHGLCAKRPHPRNRYGKIDRSRKFIVYQNTQSCKFYTPLCLCAERAMEGKKDGNETSM